MVQTNDPVQVLLQPDPGRLARGRGAGFSNTHNPPEQTATSKPEGKQQSLKISEKVIKYIFKTMVFFCKIALIICIPVI